jgi:thiamine kinase-like enzyme
MQTIPIQNEPTPAWLTAVLRQVKALGKGEVTALQVVPTGAFNSLTCSLVASYSPETPQSIPRQWVLKRNRPESWSTQAGTREARFYQMVAQLANHPKLIPPCWAYAYQEPEGSSYLLLEDLSETHTPPVTRAQQIGILEGVPDASQQEAVIDSLATLHAYWWEHPRMKRGFIEVGHWSRDKKRFDAYLAKPLSAWQDLQARRSAWLTPDWQDFYEWLFPRLSGLWKTYLEKRFRARKQLTLIHGDAYFSNFLCPKIAGSAPAYLMDWQSYSFDLGAYDLVNLLATFWTRQQRRVEGREAYLLRRYLDNLQVHGVRNYTWEDLRLDYRLGLIFWISMPRMEPQMTTGSPS